MMMMMMIIIIIIIIIITTTTIWVQLNVTKKSPVQTVVRDK